MKINLRKILAGFLIVICNIVLWTTPVENLLINKAQQNLTAQHQASIYLKSHYIELLLGLVLVLLVYLVVPKAGFDKHGDLPQFRGICLFAAGMLGFLHSSMFFVSYKRKFVESVYSKTDDAVLLGILLSIIAITIAFYTVWSPKKTMTNTKV